MTFILWISYFLLLIVFALAKSISIPNRTINLFKAFFPSWKFYEDIAQVPHLLYRLKTPQEEFGAWIPCLKIIPRHQGAIFFNPEANLLLAKHSLLQQLVQEAEEMDEKAVKNIEDAIPYQIIKNLVLSQIDQQKYEKYEYQFKIGLLMPGQSEHFMDDFLLSPIYEG